MLESFLRKPPIVNVRVGETTRFTEFTEAVEGWPSGGDCAAAGGTGTLGPEGPGPAERLRRGGRIRKGRVGTSAGIVCGILGHLAVDVDGVPVRIRGDKRRALLAALLVNADRVVSTDDLVKRVWGEGGARGRAERGALQVHMTRLRAVLGARCRRPLIVGGANGYRIDLTERQLDLLRFRALVRRAGEAHARGDQNARCDFLGRALALWRGPVLADVAGPVLHENDVPPLLEELLQAAEAAFRAALSLGRYDQVVAATGSLAVEHPERETLIRLRMEALYRSGRRSEALRVYGRTRAVLAERLGVDPGRHLQEAFHAILRADPDERALVPRQRSRLRAGAAPPAELPAAASELVGRDRELAELDRLVRPGNDRAGRVLISGPPGAGCTALAVYWAHGAARHFPGGQLYVDLRGAGGAPRPPADVLRRLLRSLAAGRGADPGATARLEPEESAARVRSLLARRRVLLVLDNAASAGQVRSLLPGTPDCAVLVTSRLWLADLLAREEMAAFAVGKLAPRDAEELLRGLVGAERADAEPRALERLASLAGHLPLALRMAAAWLRTHPGQSVTALADLVEGRGGGRGQTPMARLAAAMRGDPGFFLETGRPGGPGRW